SRFSLRIDCRAWATASLVTAQVLKTTVSPRPASSARRRTISDSNAFKRQPKVTTSTLMRSSGDAGEQRRIKTALVFELCRTRHQHVIVALAPFDHEVAAGRRDRHLAVGALQPCRSDRSRAGRRAA